MPAILPMIVSRTKLTRKACHIPSGGFGASLIAAAFAVKAGAQATPPAPESSSPQQVQRTPALQQRVPRQLPSMSALQGRLIDNSGQAIGGVTVSLTAVATPCNPPQRLCAVSDADGIFR